MLSFTKKNRAQDNTDNGYGAADTGYTGFSDFGSEYTGADFGEEVVDETVPYTDPVAVDPRPEPEEKKSTIKMMKFTSPAEREQVADCLKNGYAVIFDLEMIDRGDWSRIIDYVQGAIRMVDGSISRFSEFSLIAAPKSFDVSNLELDDLASPEAEEELPEEEEAEPAEDAVEE